MSGSSPAQFSRRRFLAVIPALAIAASGTLRAADALLTSALAADDDAFLEELERASFRYFWDCADPQTGMVKDRNHADEVDSRSLSSIAATGFGLSALCIADSRHWLPNAEIRKRVLTTLQFLHDQVPHERGFLPHFIHWKTGQRAGRCEYSSIDTAILLAGVITCREHFDDPAIRMHADALCSRADWNWMLDERKLLRHGWLPEEGLMKYHYGAYSEAVLMYLLAIGASEHRIPAECWNSFQRPTAVFDGSQFISAGDPLFVHQYPQAWFDLRGRRDRHMDYFENSVLATRAHRAWCRELRNEWPYFDDTLWGITASDSARGYEVWGGPSSRASLDGTLVPCAAGGSLPFLPEESLRCLRTMRARFGDKVWKRFGFVDAFNPASGWFAPDVLGIDAGITLLMAENLRTGFVWRTFMRSPEANRALAALSS